MILALFRAKFIELVLLSSLLALSSPMKLLKLKLASFALVIFTLGSSSLKISTSMSFLKIENGFSLRSICFVLKSGEVVFSSAFVAFSSKVNGLNLASLTKSVAL